MPWLQALGDVRTLVQALLGLATLALAEGNTHKAASLLVEAQVWGGGGVGERGNNCFCYRLYSR